MARPRLISNEQILSTMRASVLERGPAVSLDVVAERLGVTTPALLKRFGTRQELMVSALKPPDHPPWIDLVERGPDDRPLATQLEEILSAITEFFSEAMPCWVALRESGIPQNIVYAKTKGPPMARGVLVITQWLERARKQKLIATDAVETCATAIVGSLQAQAFMAHLQKKPHTARAQATYVKEL